MDLLTSIIENGKPKFLKKIGILCRKIGRSGEIWKNYKKSGDMESLFRQLVSMGYTFKGYLETVGVLKCPHYEGRLWSKRHTHIEGILCTSYSY